MSLYFSFLWFLKNTFVYIAFICMWIVLTSSGASSDASSESGVYKMAYSVFDEQYCNSAKTFYTGRSMDALWSAGYFCLFCRS